MALPTLGSLDLTPFKSDYRPTNTTGSGQIGGYASFSMPENTLNIDQLSNILLSGVPNLTPEPTWQQKYLSPALKGIGALGSLANIWMGFQGLDLAKQQLGLAKEQWATTKDEINRIKGVRNKLNQQYVGG